MQKCIDSVVKAANKSVSVFSPIQLENLTTCSSDMGSVWEEYERLYAAPCHPPQLTPDPSQVRKRVAARPLAFAGRSSTPPLGMGLLGPHAKSVDELQRHIGPHWTMEILIVEAKEYSTYSYANSGGQQLPPACEKKNDHLVHWFSSPGRTDVLY